jgi:hypothetical protein
LIHNLQPFRGRITAVNAALSNKVEKMQFFLDPTNNGNFSLNRAAMPSRYFETSVETKNVAVECAAWLDRGRRIFYKSDTQGFDELIATTVRPELWPRIFAGIMEIWCIEKPPFDTEALAAILDNFPNKIFLGNDVAGVSEIPVSTAGVLDYIKGVDRNKHRDLGFWR